VHAQALAHAEPLDGEVLLDELELLGQGDLVPRVAAQRRAQEGAERQEGVGALLRAFSPSRTRATVALSALKTKCGRSCARSAPSSASASRRASACASAARAAARACCTCDVRAATTAAYAITPAGVKRSSMCVASSPNATAPAPPAAGTSQRKTAAVASACAAHVARLAAACAARCATTARRGRGRSTGRRSARASTGTVSSAHTCHVTVSTTRTRHGASPAGAVSSDASANGTPSSVGTPHATISVRNDHRGTGASAVGLAGVGG
jgi:hypothetical protein